MSDCASDHIMCARPFTRKTRAICDMLQARFKAIREEMSGVMSECGPDLIAYTHLCWFFGLQVNPDVRKRLESESKRPLLAMTYTEAVCDALDFSHCAPLLLRLDSHPSNASCLLHLTARLYLSAPVASVLAAHIAAMLFPTFFVPTQIDVLSRQDPSQFQYARALLPVSTFCHPQRLILATRQSRIYAVKNSRKKEHAHVWFVAYCMCANTRTLC